MLLLIFLKEVVRFNFNIFGKYWTTGISFKLNQVTVPTRDCRDEAFSMWKSGLLILQEFPHLSTTCLNDTAVGSTTQFSYGVLGLNWHVTSSSAMNEESSGPPCVSDPSFSNPKMHESLGASLKCRVLSGEIWGIRTSTTLLGDTDAVSPYATFKEVRS